MMGLHPNEIREGYELACRKALAELGSTFLLPLFISTLPSRSFSCFFCLPHSFFHREQPLILIHDHKQPYPDPPHPANTPPITLLTLTHAFKPAFAAKQSGSKNILAALTADAALAVIPTWEKGFCVNDIRFVTGFLLPLLSFLSVCG